MEPVGLQHMAADRADQRIQQVARRAHPGRRGVRIDPDRFLRAHKSGSPGNGKRSQYFDGQAHGRVTRDLRSSRRWAGGSLGLDDPPALRTRASSDMAITLKRLGTYSSTSATSSPSAFISVPHSGHWQAVA